MWQILVLIQVYGFLISQADCGKMSPFMEPLGPLGPTIIEQPDTNKVDDDVIVIETAIRTKAFNPLATLISHRTLAQRIVIDQAFQKKNPQHIDVCTAIDKCIGYSRGVNGDKDLYEGFFRPLPVFLALYISYSLRQRQDQEHWTYMSIICTSSATKLKAINEAYPKNCGGKQLIDDIKNVKHDESKVLMQMLDPQFMRPDNGSDQSKVEEQMKFIPNGDDVKCDDNEDLMKFMTSTSFEQIKLVANTWSDKNNKKLVVDMFRKHCKKGLMQEAYKRVVRYAVDPYQYFAEEYYLSLEKDDFHNQNADRYLLTSRSEVDLKDIIAAYNKEHKKDLMTRIKEWDASRYNNLYLAVLVGNT